MKKVIAIAVVLVIALVGLTSYNGRTEIKNNGDDNLIAALKGGPGTTGTLNDGSAGAGGKKLD